MMEHLNEKEKFNLNEAEEHEHKIEVLLSQDPCGKSIMLRTTQRRNELTYLYMYLSPFGVRRDRMHGEIN